MVSTGSGAAVIIILCFWVPVGTGKVKTLSFKLESKKEISLKSASACLRYFLCLNHWVSFHKEYVDNM